MLYLAQGLLRPEYEGVELGMADSLARRAVATATHSEEALVARRTKESGDLGTTVGELLVGVRRLEETPPLKVAEVYAELTRIAEAKGAGSQDVKVQILSDLLVRASRLEGKFLVRFVLGTLRVGVREMTILDALAEAFGDGSKSVRQQIESAFNLSSDLELVAGVLVEKGAEGLATVSLEVGRPMRAMLAEREPNLAAVLKRMDGRAALEYKYDGLRVQAHIPKSGPVRLFSRRLEEISAQFPELVEELPGPFGRSPRSSKASACLSTRTPTRIQPFQQVSRRRGRKHDLDRVRDEVPVCLFTFDVFLLAGTPVYGKPFPERRALLEKALAPTERVRLAVQRVVTNEEDAQSFFDEAIAAGGEGVMAKSLADGSAYRAGARGFWWIKYQNEVHGGPLRLHRWRGGGRLPGPRWSAGRYGAFLLAVYNPKLDRFESFCKVGSGFDDAQLAEMPKRLHRFEVDERPPEVVTGLTPDRWMRPGVVLEVRGAELTLSPVHRAGLGAIRPVPGSPSASPGSPAGSGTTGAPPKRRPPRSSCASTAPRSARRPPSPPPTPADRRDRSRETVEAGSSRPKGIRRAGPIARRR